MPEQPDLDRALAELVAESEALVAEAHELVAELRAEGEPPRPALVLVKGGGDG